MFCFHMPVLVGLTYKSHAIIVASSIIFTVSFLISVHPSLICLVILRLYFQLLLQPLIEQWYLFVWRLYCGSEVDDLLVTGACLNFFSCLLRFWIKVNVLLHVTSRHLKIPFPLFVGAINIVSINTIFTFYSS